MSFIQNFLKANEGGECPKPYLIWAAYGVLSATIGRRVELDCVQFVVTPNIYTLLVGPSGGRKTAARDKAVELLLEAVPDIVLAGDNETYQGIIQYMHSDKSDRFYTDVKGIRVSYKPYCIFAPELMDYLQLNPVGMVSFLTNIYDRKYYNYRLKHEEHILERPYVMMCACSTPEWLTDQLKAKQFAEGYGRRTIVVCHEHIIRKRPTTDQVESDAKTACISRLREIMTIGGPMKLTTEADKWFWDVWYVNQKDPDDFFLRKWRSTLHVNLLKVAILTSVSESNDRVITLAHMQLSLALLEEVEKNMPMLTGRMGRSELMEPALNILAVVRNRKGIIPLKELKMLTFKDFKNAMEQWSLIEHLKQTDQIVEISHKGDNGVERKMICLPQCVIKA